MLTFQVTIEQRRALAREEVGPILLTRLLARKCRKKCPHDSPLGNFATLAYVAHITGIAPWPPELGRCRQQTIRSIIESLENRTDHVITSSCTHRQPMIIPACDFRSFANELRRLTSGLCLDCVKEGSMQSHLCVKTEHGRAGS